MKKGIDISTFQRNVDYNKLKKDGIEFAIIRCGYGREINQKDIMFEKHYEGLTKVGIPAGTYLYSYATSFGNAQKEIQNCLNLIKGKSFPVGVFYDLEDSKTVGKLGKYTITRMAQEWNNKISNAGYVAGIYANLNWFSNYIDIHKINNYKIWLAQYNSQITADFKPDIWQYTSKGKVNGINGNVDMNYLINDYIITTPEEKTKENKKTHLELLNEIIDGKWGNGLERRIKLIQAGYDDIYLQSLLNSYYKVAGEVINGKYGNGQDRKDNIRKLGYNSDLIQKIVNNILKG